METIFSLKSLDGDLRKSFGKYKGDLKPGIYFEPILHQIEGLKDIYSLIKDLRSKDETFCFIRGNPNEQRLWGNSWRRKKIDSGDGFYTIDESKSWAMFDIDDIEMREDEEHNAQILRKRIAEEIDFLEEDTEMIIDFSSSAQLSRKGEKHKRVWKAHVYVWFEETITCRDLHTRLGNYEGLIDRATIISNQCNYFEEPIIDKTYWDCDITERTFVFEGKKCKLPSVSYASPRNSLALKSTVRERMEIDSIGYENRLYQATQGLEGRYLATWRYFCYVVNTNRNRDYAIQKIWDGTNRWQGFKTKEDVEKKMQEAWDFCTKQYLGNITIGRHNLIELETDNITKQIHEIVRGVMMIKSPQSTYKTQLLKRIPKDASVLLITHRISLSRDICKQIGLFNYQEASCDEELLEQNRLGITHHSLHRLMNTTKGYSTREILDDLSYDYVILDESEQFLSDIMFTTLFDSRPFDNNDVFNYVGQFVQRAKTVYVADADMSDLTKLFLEVFRTEDEKFNIYQNDYRMGGKTVYGLQSQNLVLEKVYEDLRRKKRIFITCERKDCPYETFLSIKERFPKANIIHINGETDKRKHKELWDNPNKELPLLFNGQSRMNDGEFLGKNLDVLIVNSVMQTGFSIGQKDDMDNRFHSVYGIFDNQHMIYTGSDMRQALRRVRNADRYYAYILNKKEYIRNIDEILDMVHGEQSEISFDGMRKSKERAIAISKFNRKLNFIAHLEDCGWRYQQSDDLANVKEYFEQMQIVKKEKQQELMLAKSLTDKEFFDVLHDSDFGNELAKKKYIIEKSFNSRITEKLIVRYANGDIERKYKIRDVLAQDIESLCKREGADDIFLIKSLRRLFSEFGIDFERMNDPHKTIYLWAYQIDDNLMKWLFEERNAEALNFHLNAKYGLSLSATNYKGLDEDKLRFFVKIAKFLDFDCAYKDKNNVAENENRQRCTYAVLKKHAKAWHRETKKNATKGKRKLYENELNLLTRFGGETFSATKDEYVEKLKSAINSKQKPRGLEIDFLKDQESHIEFRNFQTPQYTRFLKEFIREYSSHIDSIDTSSKITNEKTHSSSQQQIWDI